MTWLLKRGVWVAVFCLLLQGCVNLTPTIEATSSSTPAAPPTVIALIATIRPITSTSTKTKTPTPAATRRPTLTRTPSPSPTITPTPFTTLEATAKLDFVVQSLKTNRNCDLPCWWGIVPGKTNWDDMLNFFAGQGIDFLIDEQPNLGVIDGSRLLDIVFQKENGLVQGIDIETAYNNYLLARSQYSNLWRKYALDQILKRFGTPTQVYLELTVGAGDWSPGMQATYDLWLEYADDGIAIRYPGVALYDAGGEYVCPLPNNTSGLAIRLRVPNSQTPFVSLSTDNPFQFNGTLEKLTGLNPQQFYENFIQNPPHSCLLVTDPDPWWTDKITLPDTAAMLSFQQEDNFLTNQLADNKGCELPCWWGIQPGVTTSEDARQKFLRLGKSMSRQEDGRGLQFTAGLFGRHEPYPFDYTIRHRWFDENGVVKLFGVTGSALNWSPPQYFAQDWRRYSLAQALARYGLPSKVLMHYWSFGWQYDITLVYEAKGFLIRYSGPIIDEGQEYSDTPLAICPTQNKPTAITIWTAEPGSDALENFADGRSDLSPSHTPMPALEEVTDMTVRTFYKTFLNPNSTTCLSVPRNKGEFAP